MIRVLFVCYGNICRSPMAEFIFRDMLRREKLDGAVAVESAATSTEELGHDMYPPARRKLQAEGVPFTRRQSRQITRADYGRHDYLIGMDSRNISAMHRAFGGDPEGKIRRLLEYGNRPRDIADPWYTGDFDATYSDLIEGCEALLAELRTRL